MKLILNIIFFLIPEQSTFRITDQFQRLYKVHHHIKLIKYLRCPDFFFCILQIYLLPIPQIYIFVPFKAQSCVLKRHLMSLYIIHVFSLLIKNLVCKDKTSSTIHSCFFKYYFISVLYVYMHLVDFFCFIMHISLFCCNGYYVRNYILAKLIKFKL